MELNFSRIATAVENLLNNPESIKIEGKYWKVYRVGSIIRIDIDSTKVE